jgi:hypothetical protein
MMAGCHGESSISCCRERQVGLNEERRPRDVAADRIDGDADSKASRADDEQQLLDAVLRETMGNANQAALELIFDVARKSQYPDTSRIEAVEELVRAIMRRAFGPRKFPRRLIHRVASSLIEAPEATIRIERLWQEARASG